MICVLQCSHSTSSVRREPGACGHPHNNRPGYGSGECGEAERCPVCEHDEDMKEAILSSKLDAIAGEYNHLLSSGLESQRQYFEGLLQQQQAEAEVRLAAAVAASDRTTVASKTAVGEAKEAERKRHALEKQLVGSCTWQSQQLIL